VVYQPTLHVNVTENALNAYNRYLKNSNLFDIDKTIILYIVDGIDISRIPIDTEHLYPLDIDTTPHHIMIIETYAEYLDVSVSDVINDILQCI